ncbi:hypothetical protein ACHAWC_003370 [Mediolabrus comicus]
MKKTQILSAGVPLAALLLAYSSTKADAAGIRGSILLPDRPLQELTSIHRRLEDANDDANDDGYADEQRGDEVENEDEQVEEVEDENDEDEGEAFETDDAGSNYGGSGTTTATIQAKVEQYEAEAAQIFETAPAEWSVGQWDMFFALFGAILVTCCVISAFFAYCCIFREDDDVYSRRVRRRRRHKKRDDETVATEYTKDMSLLNPSESQTCAESRVYSPRIHKGAFSPKSWVSGGFSGEDTVVTRDDSKSYAAPSVSNVSNKSKTFDDDIPRQNTSISDAENTNVLAM